MVVAHSMEMMNFYSAILNGATISCSMNFFTVIKALVSVQATRLAGQDLLQYCFSSQEYRAKTIRWEFRVLGTGRLYHWVTSRWNVVDLTHHSFPHLPKIVVACDESSPPLPWATASFAPVTWRGPHCARS